MFWDTSTSKLCVLKSTMWGLQHTLSLALASEFYLSTFIFPELLSPGVKNKNLKSHRTYRLFAGEHHLSGTITYF